MGDPQDTGTEAIQNALGMLGIGMSSKFDGPKEKIMREILTTKTMYDTEFDRLNGVFAPHLQYLDSQGSHHTILFLDPMKLQSAEAFGIKPMEFLSFALHEKGLEANPLQLWMMFNNAASVTGTAPCSIPVTDAFKHNAADVVIPKSHMRQVQLDIPGLKQSEITQLVNYHEFFHCLHDKYATAHAFENTPQKREMFADVGAMLEMMRRGKGADIIDEMIVWRLKGKDDQHATVPALLSLKKYVKEHGGVEGVRNMKTKDILDLCYKATEDGSSMSWMQRLKSVMDSAPDLQRAAKQQQVPNLSFKDLPFNKDPVKILEDKAFALGGKITPKTLMDANNALQKEYADAHDKNPNDLSTMFLAGFVESTYMKLVKGTDYIAANSKRGAALTADDIQEISFVQNKPMKVATTGARALVK